MGTIHSRHRCSAGPFRRERTADSPPRSALACGPPRRFWRSVRSRRRRARKHSRNELVDLDPASLVRQGTGANEIRSELRRTNMDHVKASLDGLLLVVLANLEPSFLGRTVDPDEAAIEIERHAIFLDIFHQRRDIVLDAEKHAARAVKLDGRVLEMTVPEPMIAGKIKRLLRGAVAFDRQGGVRGQSAAATKLFHKAPRVRRKVEAIVGCDAVFAKRLGKALD